MFCPPPFVHAFALMWALPPDGSGPWAQSCSHSSWRSVNSFAVIASLTGRIVSLFNVGGGTSFISNPVHLYWLWWRMVSAIQTAVAPQLWPLCHQLSKFWPHVFVYMLYTHIKSSSVLFYHVLCVACNLILIRKQIEDNTSLITFLGVSSSFSKIRTAPCICCLSRF